ncbi:MAG: type II CAAX endopeptidase family protein [Bacteroidales bacterium]
MNIWTKILLFFPLWLLFSVIFYGIIFLIYPESFSGSKTEFDTLISTNFGLLIISQIAVFLSTFSAIFFVSKVIDKKKPAFLDSMLKPKGLLFGVVLGAIEIALIILLLSLTTKIIITFQGFKVNILLYVVIFFLIAVSEEAMSRGFIFANLYNQSNKYLAIIISSLIFSLMHAFNSSFNWIAMLNIVLVGILFCQLYLKSMNLSIPIGLHFSWNFFQGPLFGFSVSGFSTQGVLKIESLSGSRFPFEGFGLEGSLISTLVISFFIVYFYVTNTKRIIHSDKTESSAIKVTILKAEA